jgi:SAM-dependent methyltransferase
LLAACGRRHATVARVVAARNPTMSSRILSQVTPALHGRLIFRRRVRALAGNIAQMIPDGAATLLDIGCGDGTLARSIMNHRPGLNATGVEIRARQHTAIPVQEFDGRILPFGDRSHDVVMLVDVLHHAAEPTLLIREARRVAREAVMIKDHLTGAWLSHERLRMMDWVGNFGRGVPLRYAYWSPEQWHDAFREAGLREVDRRESLGLYGPPLRWLFERRLHFVSRLVPQF